MSVLTWFGPSQAAETKAKDLETELELLQNALEEKNSLNASTASVAEQVYSFFDVCMWIWLLEYGCSMAMAQFLL